MDRTGVAAHPARRIRQDRHGAGAGARDEQLLLLDQPLRAICCKRGCDRSASRCCITILQNDTGSGIVLGAFLFVLYREGLNKWLCIPVLLIAALFIVSFLLSPMTLLVLLILICVVSEAMMNGRVAFAHRSTSPRWRSRPSSSASFDGDSSPPARWTSTRQPADRDARCRWSVVARLCLPHEPDAAP